MKEDNSIIIGRNAVMEALKGGHPIEKIFLLKGGEGSLLKIEGKAKAVGIPIEYGNRNFFDKKFPQSAHQGVVAIGGAYHYQEVSHILNVAKERGEDPFVLILDGIEDPHNLGAIMRSAECAGAHGVIISKKRAVGLTFTVAKASAGAIEHIPCARVPNISSTIKDLQKEGLWIAACDMGATEYTQVDYKGPVGLVIGNEGKGISKLVRENCDFVASIPLCGKITSLNASNAAAVMMYEVRRQRNEK